VLLVHTLFTQTEFQFAILSASLQCKKRILREPVEDWLGVCRVIPQETPRKPPTNPQETPSEE